MLPVSQDLRFSSDENDKKMCVNSLLTEWRDGTPRRCYVWTFTCGKAIDSSRQWNLVEKSRWTDATASGPATELYICCWIFGRSSPGNQSWHALNFADSQTDDAIQLQKWQSTKVITWILIYSYSLSIWSLIVCNIINFIGDLNLRDLQFDSINTSIYSTNNSICSLQHLMLIKIVNNIEAKPGQRRVTVVDMLLLERSCKRPVFLCSRMAKATIYCYHLSKCILKFKRKEK